MGTSKFVAWYVQVSSVYLNPKWIGSYKHMRYTEIISFLTVHIEILNLERL